MLIGHHKQWQYLKKLAETKKIPHAFLFFGEEKLGKKTLALEFVKFLNCQNLSRPCQNCRFCQDIKKGIFPDFLLISPQKKEIQISQIKELQHYLSFKPYQSFYKTVVIDQAHLLNQEAQSCLLKTLEEPKGQAILFLITEYPEMLFETILSRVQELRFFPIKISEIEEYLEKKDAKPEQAKELAYLSQGRPGVALDFFFDSKKVKSFKEQGKELETLISSSLISRFNYAKDLSTKEPQEIKEVLYIWLQYFRKKLLTENKNYLPKTKKILNFIQRTNFLIERTNVSSRLALEILMLEL